jgi:hypothetical protein
MKSNSTKKRTFPASSVENGAIVDNEEKKKKSLQITKTSSEVFLITSEVT